ncbi:hypothetical protein [Actinomyces minihominis]|uniref:hypothetical protein n=1 Tax=Actinomyces minihominis TaxID=2002838 RepID=UPI001A936C43|nr:hypothetical protein [Actinomyces minihominis]
MVHLPLIDVLIGTWEAELGVALGKFSVGTDGDHVLEEQAGLFLQGHLTQKDLYAIINAATGVKIVAVDRICLDLDPEWIVRTATAVADGLQSAWLLDPTIDMPADLQKFLNLITEKPE